MTEIIESIDLNRKQIKIVSSIVIAVLILIMVSQGLSVIIAVFLILLVVVYNLKKFPDVKETIKPVIRPIIEIKDAYKSKEQISKLKLGPQEKVASYITKVFRVGESETQHEMLITNKRVIFINLKSKNVEKKLNKLLITMTLQELLNTYPNHSFPFDKIKQIKFDANTMTFVTDNKEARYLIEDEDMFEKAKSLFSEYRR